MATLWAVVQYVYNSWGMPVSTTGTKASTVGAINPFRYRGYVYGTESGLYYLQSRYYNPEWGRFVNGDGYTSTGQGFTGSHMYVYCGNDPVKISDPSGHMGVLEQRVLAQGKGPQRLTSSLLPNTTLVALNAPSQKNSGSSVSKFKNQDGSYSLYDNRRHDPGNVFHEQILSAKITGPKASIKDKQLGVGSLDVSAYTGGWEWKYADLSLFDAGKATLYAGRGKGYVGIGAMASAWSPEITVHAWRWDITVGADVGTIGAQLGVKDGKLKIGAGYMGGLHIEIGPQY